MTRTAKSISQSFHTSERTAGLQSAQTVQLSATNTEAMALKRSKTFMSHINSKIKTERDILSDKLEDMFTQVRSIECHIDSITQAKEEKCRKIVEKIHQTLDEQMKERILNLLGKKEKLTMDISKIEECQNKVKFEVDSCSKLKLINKSEKVVDHIRGVSNQIISHQYKLDPEQLLFKSDLCPEYLKGVFIIVNYPQMIEEKEIIYSEPLVHYGITWRLKVYPNGNGQAKGNYLSVFLEMVKGNSSSAKYDYKIEMENLQNPLISVSREYTSEFEVGECWGYNRFYRTESIINEGFIDEENSLKLEFFVRASSYSQHCEDQDKYIKRLESKVAKLEQKCDENDINLSDEEEKESEKDEATDEELDKLPMSESKRKEDELSDDDNLILEERKNDQDQEEDSKSDSDAKSIDDSLQDNEEQRKVEEAVNGDLEQIKNEISNKMEQRVSIEEIQERMEEYKLNFDVRNIMSDSHSEHLKNLELAEAYRSPNHSIEDDIEHKELSEANIEHITSELAQAESQIKRITSVNDTFKHTFEGEEHKFEDSDDDFNADISVDTSEGSLSRDGTEELKSSYAEYDYMNNHLVEVSPDSPIEQKDRINYTQLNSQIAFPNIGEGSQPEISLQDDDYTSDQIESL